MLQNLSQYSSLLDSLEAIELQNEDKVQLLTKLLSEPNYFSIKNIDEYIEKKGTISKSKNRQLYDLLCEKHLNCIYKLRPNPVGENLIKGKEKFDKLSILEQIYVLLQILQLSQLINQGANLELIGFSKNTGKTLTSKIISNCNEIKLINQSITGLYENEVDLLTI